ncbi:MAG: efflux RND transporter periplasmic adaptor subunit, partial [Firmicutes bacterium]|nr:efflux RND transporter periplasmic adaptor subunit [Bacillota bacterium]
MKNKKAIIIAGVLTIVLILIFMRGGGVPVEILKVEPGPFTGYIEENGIVEARGAREVQAAASGRVSEIKVTEGQQVKTGDILAALEKGDLQSEVERTKALVRAAQSQLAGAIKGAGDNEMAQARAEVNQAKANLSEAQRQAGQAGTLLKSGGISSEEYQQKITAVKLQNNNLAIANARLKMLLSGAGQSERQALQALVEQAQAQLKTAEIQLNQADITAPIDGVVLRKYVEPGTFIQPGTSLFKVGPLTELEVRADILETEAVRVKVGQKVSITGDVLGKLAVAGKVT